MSSPWIATRLLLGQASDAAALSPAGLVNAVVPLVGLIGVGVMLWGAYHALVHQLALESPPLRAQLKADGNRLPFSHYLALGLEFMIAASAIKTLNDYSLQQVAVLGGMVLCRALVGLYPRWDVRPDLAGAKSLAANTDPAAAASSVAAEPAANHVGESAALAASVAQMNSATPVEAQSVVASPPVITMAS
jgi:uncharacterized membrane protein